MLHQTALDPAEEPATQRSLRRSSRSTLSSAEPNLEPNVIPLIPRLATPQQDRKAAIDQAVSPAHQVEDDFGGLEPFVDAEVVGRFLGIEPRRVQELARAGQLPAHPIGRGKRRAWRFRVSEIAEAMTAPKPPSAANIPVAVPGTKRRNRLG